PARPHCVREPPPFFRERREPSVGGIHDERGPTASVAALGPVAHAHLARSLLAVVGLLGVLSPLDALLVLLVGDELLLAILFGALERRAGEMADRPQPPQVRLAPRRHRMAPARRVGGFRGRRAAVG